MINTDYLKAHSKSEFVLMLALEDEKLEGKKSIDDLSKKEKEDILGDDKSNKRSRLVHRLAGLGMEYLWVRKEHEEEDDFTDFHEFPPHVLLFFRRIMQSEIKKTLIGKISRAQTAKEKEDTEKQKKTLASITDQDIQSFTAELRQDYEEWKRVYLDHHGIDETEFETWREKTNQKTENLEHDNWYDLAEWYQHAYRKEKEAAKTSTTQEGPAKPIEKQKLAAAKLERGSQRRTGKRLDEILDKIQSNEASRTHGVRGDQVEDDFISDETMARMLELHAELGSMERMLAEVKLLIEQKRDLELLRETIHRNLDEVIERVYGLNTITERQFEALMPYEVHSLKDAEKTASEELEGDLATEQGPQQIMLPMSLKEGNQAGSKRQDALMFTNAHKLRYVKILSERLETICEEQKESLDKAMKEIQANERATIFRDTED